ncbi:Set1/Ash2 histone methyltransferase complex subunit ASH2 [Dermatophagoides pteronyssinus]|uniref:Set1/Ash2 histone methyltransferase complex subunit ASH2 n=2 Tax=Dermatophagoides pteronyssinus TaxID=6956 RepID=A0ABQ8JKJ7_DERPT|nr:set1/Ash2 histone methyltransferase complex subunit ASH2-like [Dermatophagoides pteronyssinus]KAH9423128.1 Set1/Ash2 histone methyltransferase complex subunit ASH2 [Dermatophagoides pteronyssinus]
MLTTMDAINDQSSNDASNPMKSDYVGFQNEDSNLVSSESNDKCGMDENSINNNNNKMFYLPPKNCYCGRDRDLGKVEFLCAKCMKWFHECCVNLGFTHRLIPFLTTYVFFCQKCSPNNMESFKRTPTNFSQICQTAIANLIHAHSSEEKIAFSKDKEIIPFIDVNWNILANKPKPQKNTWHSSVAKTMQKDNDTFVCNDDQNNLHVTLRDRDLSRIAPNYENLKNLKELNGGQNANANISSRSLRGMKKRTGQLEVGNEMILTNKRQKSELSIPKLPASGFPSEFLFNKEGFRYILAEPDDNAPSRKEFDERHEFAGKQIPGFLCRKLMPENILLSMNDRAHYLKISEDRKTVTGEKGYSSIRATYGVSHGTWYYETRIIDKPEDSACRIGWAQELAQLFTPIGYDKFGYSCRSLKGTKFHESIGKHYMDGGYDIGDVIGCLIHLPRPKDVTSAISMLPKTYKDKPLFKFKSFLYFQEKDEPIREAVAKLKPFKGAKIVYFRNGQKIGVAFDNIYSGLYYPAASLFKNISVNFNFGPHFQCPPDGDAEFGQFYRPMSDVVFDTQIEQTLADVIYLVENEGKLSLDVFYQN